MKKLKLKSEPRSTKCFNKIKSKIKLGAEANDYAIEPSLHTGSIGKFDSTKHLLSTKGASSIMNNYHSSTTALETNACTQSMKSLYSNQDSLRLGKLLQSKREKDIQAIQMHSRIQFLQNEEQKKLLKI